MLTDDQRRVLAEMCGWEFIPNACRTGSWANPERDQMYFPEPPPIEEMPEEWVKLMERVLQDYWEFGHSKSEGYYADGCIDGHKIIYADTIGECVCLAALAMEDK